MYTVCRYDTHKLIYVKLAELETHEVTVKSYGQHTYSKEVMKSSKPPKPEFYGTQHFRLKFYATDIIFPFIQMNTRRIFDFLWNKIWSQKIPPPPNVLA